MAFIITNTSAVLVNNSGQPIDCSTCPCGSVCAACILGTHPAQLQVVITSARNNTCVNCTNLNATWVLDLDDPQASTDNCTWSTTAGLPCSYTKMEVKTFLDSIEGPNSAVRVILHHAVDTDTFGSNNNISSSAPHDCDTVLHNLSRPGDDIGTCDIATASTALITVL